MATVRLTSVGVARPDRALDVEAAGAAAGPAGGNPDRAGPPLQGSRRPRARAAASSRAGDPVPDSIEARNNLYRRLAPELACRAAAQALGARRRRDIGCLVTSSSSGYAVPGWAVDVVERLGLPPTTVRVPLTESGCAGGALAIARATDYLRSRPGEAGIAVAAELGSVSSRLPGADSSSSWPVFGDGSGAALLETGPGDGLEVVDCLSYLVPRSRHELGSDLTDRGFRATHSDGLADVLSAPTHAAVRALLRRNGLETRDVDAWLIHPGDPRTLASIEGTLGVHDLTRWSWNAMLELGEASPATVFDVLLGYIDESPRGHAWAVLVAFGPGVSIELVLFAATRGGRGRPS